MKRETKRIYIVRDKFSPSFIFGHFKHEKDAYHYINNVFDLEKDMLGMLDISFRSKKEYLEVIPDIIITYINK